MTKKAPTKSSQTSGRNPRPFWQRKTLAEMTRKEWESLCDGCGRCCLNKFEDEDTGQVHYTDVACKLLDHGTCRCSDYSSRTRLVPDCAVLSPGTMNEMDYLPNTCAYRRLHLGQSLAWWHPLVSGSPHTVEEAGISVRGRIVSEEGLSDEEMLGRIVRWPKWGRGRRRPS